jgi:hypothetical protein
VLTVVLTAESMVGRTAASWDYRLVGKWAVL